MQRHTTSPRPDWQKRVESLGFAFHSLPATDPDAPATDSLAGASGSDLYWDESAYYEFTADEIDVLEKAANDVHALCLRAVEHVLENNLFARFHLPPEWAAYVRQSWDADEPTLYGRFDFGYDGAGPPKLLEYNADTPTALLEAAVIQWHWLQDTQPRMDQFNSIHEHLIEAWKWFGQRLQGTMYFTGVPDSLEDEITLFYLRDTAMQAGLKTFSIPIQRVGWDYARKLFVDGGNQPIRHLFKLYPWEWLMREEFGKFILRKTTAWIEPAWKMLLSNKAILALLWELFPGHPNLLRTSVEPFGGSYVRKPCVGREGANVQIVFDGQEFVQTEGDYGPPYVYQEIFPLPKFDANLPVLGCWIVGAEACGMGIRESKDLITTNTSRFVPHLFPSR